MPSAKFEDPRTGQAIPIAGVARIEADPAPNLRTPVTTSLSPALRWPAPVLGALGRIAGPTLPVSTVETFVVWAEDNLSVYGQCGGTPEMVDRDKQVVYGRITGGVEHALSIDPHTNTYRASVATNADATPEQVHFLWAMDVGGFARNGCDLMWHVVNSVFTSASEEMPGCYFTPGQKSRFRDVRTIMRTVQYLDAGLDIHEHADLIDVGLRPADAHALVTASAAGRFDRVAIAPCVRAWAKNHVPFPDPMSGAGTVGIHGPVSMIVEAVIQFADDPSFVAPP